MMVFAVVRFVFGVLGGVQTHNGDVTTTCLRLGREFQSFVVRTHALRKVFLSIKGTYYQAEVQGQAITFLVPHRYHQTLPRDVDYRVLGTFLEFYETLLGFVLYKLYHDEGLYYPPRLGMCFTASLCGSCVCCVCLLHMMNLHLFHLFCKAPVAFFGSERMSS